MSSVNQNEDTMRPKDHVPSHSEVKASVASADNRSIRESAVLRFSALALALSAVFPGAASANDSHSAVQPRIEPESSPTLPVEPESRVSISSATVLDAPISKSNEITSTSILSGTETNQLQVAENVTVVEYYIGTIKDGTNIRAGKGTDTEIVGRINGGNQQFKLIDFDPNVRLDSNYGIEIEGISIEKDGKMTPIEAFVRADLLLGPPVLEKVTAQGSNTGGLVPSQPQEKSPDPTSKEDADKQEVTIKDLAEMIADPVLGGNDPVEPVEGVSLEQVNQVLSESFLAAYQTQTGLTLAEIQEIIQSNADILLKIPTENEAGPANRAPAVLSADPFEVTIKLSKGIEISYFKTEKDARSYITSLGITFDYSAGKWLLDNNKKRVGTFFTISSYDTNAFVFPKDGKLNFVFGDTNANARYYTAHFLLLFIAHAEAMFDTTVNGKPTFVITETAKALTKALAAGSDSFTLRDKAYKIPPELSFSKFYSPDASQSFLLK